MKGGASGGGGGGSGGVARCMQSGGMGGAASLSEVEVFLEWKRGKKSKLSKKKHAKAGRKQGEYGDGEGEGEGEGNTSRDASRSALLRKRHILIASESSPMGSNTLLPVSGTMSQMAPAARKKKNRLSTGSRASVNEDPDVTLANASKFERGRSKAAAAAAAQGEDDDGQCGRNALRNVY
ncbi:hypothetical protein GYMLUDRAFT_249458 [Collybiopsis luxurians FD-317 M1]|uniref:Uncharacterized protein n=1 Tax=Collybiopsis luxurians FD-317 M1 TaxID=944289 RepID=A0A0D0AVL2_9AGAR|nr:hypothetical protein GYMLUDRAFT_249458 [Collybiopsis luxurians FD-317 M1]